MPGYRKGKGGPCQQRQRRGMRLLLCPSLLVLLADGESHGYELYDQLVEFGFNHDRLDSSIVYRELRDLDDQGLINSTWDEKDSKGPKRRVYRIQSEGYLRLEEWIIHLEKIRDRIDVLIAHFEKLQDKKRKSSP